MITHAQTFMKQRLHLCVVVCALERLGTQTNEFAHACGQLDSDEKHAFVFTRKGAYVMRLVSTLGASACKNITGTFGAQVWATLR